MKIKKIFNLYYFNLILLWKLVYKSNFLPQEATVKPPNAVTSIRQSPVLKGHIFVVLS
jgi:hypothetical protein